MEGVALVFGGLYKDKRVLVTGHTGFKGSWLSIWLNELGADVTGYALAPNDPRDNYTASGLDTRMQSVIGDIRDLDRVIALFQKFKPDIVFHLAAQSLVKRSYSDPLETMSVNIMGTVNVLEAIRLASHPITGIFITSDKCYENKEQLQGYKETDALGGYDPYSASKGADEIIVSSYRNSFFNPNKFSSHNKSIASARAGNVIGGGDHAADRIVPDCIRSLDKGEPITLRNPGYVRPWQHVLDPIGGYMLLAMKMIHSPGSYCEAWNFGPNDDSLIKVSELADHLIEAYGAGSWVDGSDPKAIHETNYLALDCRKAKKYLNWHPVLDIESTIKMTADWYKRSKESNDCYPLAQEQIAYYEHLLDRNNNDPSLLSDQVFET